MKVYILMNYTDKTAIPETIAVFPTLKAAKNFVAFHREKLDCCCIVKGNFTDKGVRLFGRLMKELALSFGNDQWRGESEDLSKTIHIMSELEDFHGRN